MYSRIQTIAVQYRTSSVRNGTAIHRWGTDKHLECLVYVLSLTDINVFFFVKNKYMFIIGNLKIIRKQKRSKQELCIVISPKMITSIVQYVFLTNVFTYFFLKIGAT